VAKWSVRRASGAPKALAVALSFAACLGWGGAKQAFAKKATPHLDAIVLAILCDFNADSESAAVKRIVQQLYVRLQEHLKQFRDYIYARSLI